MRKITSILFLLLSLCVVTSTAHAVVTDWWITDANDPTNTRIDNMVIGNIGDPDAVFKLSMWYSIDVPDAQVQSVQLFLGFASTAAQKDTALPADALFSASATSGLNSAFNYLTPGAFGGAWANSTNGTVTRPYGVKVSASKAIGVTSLPNTAKMFDIEFTNTGLLPGQSYALQLYSFGTGTQGWQNYVVYKPASTNLYAYGTTSEFTVTARQEQPVVPEPASMLALGSGVVALFGFVRRRRS